MTICFGAENLLAACWSDVEALQDIYPQFESILPAHRGLSSPTNQHRANSFGRNTLVQHAAKWLTAYRQTVVGWFKQWGEKMANSQQPLELRGHDKISRVRVYGEDITDGTVVLETTDDTSFQDGQHVARIELELHDQALLSDWLRDHVDRVTP